MATRIRLQRHGKKGKPVYHIVIADQRSPRDGRYIEKIGLYNPNINPAVIDLNFDKSVEWVMKGAQPSDTVKAILSYKGVYMKKHLLVGVEKGAFDENEAQNRFDKWIADKEAKITDKKSNLEKENQAAKKAKLEAEKQRYTAKAESLEGILETHLINLDSTNILSPITGIIANRIVEPGVYMKKGWSLMSVVPIHDVWVIANFKETQIKELAVGQEVEIRVDAFSNFKLSSNNLSFNSKSSNTL